MLLPHLLRRPKLYLGFPFGLPRFLLISRLLLLQMLLLLLLMLLLLLLHGPQALADKNRANGPHPTSF